MNSQNHRSSPDLFDDYNMDHEIASIDHDTNINQLRYQSRFSCSKTLDNSRQCLLENNDFFRQELSETESTCLANSSRPPAAMNRYCGLFDFSFDLDRLSLRQEEDAESVFNLLRMLLYELESKSGIVERGVFCTKSNDTLNLRNQISAILAFLVKNISRLCREKNASAKEILKNLVLELKGILLQIGRIHQAPMPGYSAVKDGYPYFHVCLDIWYAVLKILVIIQRSWPDGQPFIRIAEYSNEIDGLALASTLEQLTDILLSDLISLAALRFTNEAPLSDNCWCFPCPCILKLWYLVNRFWNITVKADGGESFWSRLHKAIRRFYAIVDERQPRTQYSDRFNTPAELRKTNIDRSIFIWRFIGCLSPLYCDPPDDDGSTSATSPSDIRAIVEFGASETILPLLRNSSDGDVAEITHSMQTELKLRLLLSQYLNVYSAYRTTPSSLVPLELWNYYQKRLQFSFCSQEISGLLLVYESAVKWLEKLRSIPKPTPMDLPNDRRSSYELFLAIVVTHCVSEDATDGMKLWNQLKGRILSKLSSRRFNEFSEVALFNCLRLLLTAASFLELDIINDYVLDYVSEMPLQCSSGGVSKQKIVWQALSVAIILHQERTASNENASAISQYLASSVIAVQHAYARKKNDLVVRRNLWELLSYYFKLLREISHGANGKRDLVAVLPLWTMEYHQLFVEAKDDVNGQHRIDFLSAVRDISVNLGELVENEWQRVDYQERLKWHGVIKDRLLRAVRQHLHSWPWSNELADVWCNFIILGVKKSDFNLPPAIALFNEFINVSTSNFDPSILCRFLGKLAEKPEVLFQISGSESGASRMEEAAMAVTKAWLRCVFISPTSSSAISRISKFVSETAPWRELLQDYRSNGYITTTSAGHDSDHCQLFKEICCALEFRSAVNSAERQKIASLCQRTFGPPIRKLTKLLKTAEPVDVYFHCTRLLAFLVEHCAPLIHGDPNESLLRDIIQLTVCNAGAENTTAVVKKRRVEMATECLLPILKGLFKCDWNQQELFRKQITDCYRMEFMRLAYDRKTNIMDSSPLVVLLKESFAPDYTGPLESLRRILLKDVGIFAATRCNDDKSVARASLVYLRCMVERTRSVWILNAEAEDMAWICLSLWLIHDDRSVVADCMEVIDVIRAKLDQHRSLAEVMGEGFGKVAIERWEASGWKRILNLAYQVIKRFPNIKKEMIECVEKVTEGVKRQIGSGEDMALTAALHYFNAEISIL